MEGGAGMRPVTKEQFYAAIGHLNVHPQIQPGPYPYTSLWKHLNGSGVVGKSVGVRDGGMVRQEYFLKDGYDPR